VVITVTGHARLITRRVIIAKNALRVRRDAHFLANDFLQKTGHCGDHGKEALEDLLIVHFFVHLHFE
jgi:hypothetical protein